MAVRLVCRACGERLKLPEGLTAKRSAKCPKCLAPVDLTAAPKPAPAPKPTTPPKPPPLLGAGDPLPVKPPTAVEATAFEPGEDVITLAPGRAFEVWLPELVTRRSAGRW